MRRVFLDTSGLIAASARTDRNHEPAARELARLQKDRAIFVIHEGIRIELLDCLSALALRRQAVALLQSIAASAAAGELEIAPLDAGLIDRALELFQQRPDKAWGMTDCLSFVLMNDRGIREAFTSDHHFEQAGFVRLIRS